MKIKKEKIQEGLHRLGDIIRRKTESDLQAQVEVIQVIGEIENLLKLDDANETHTSD